MERKISPESVVREIRRRTRKKYSAEEKIRIVLESLRGEESINAICRKIWEHILKRMISVISGAHPIILRHRGRSSVITEPLRPWLTWITTTFRKNSKEISVILSTTTTFTGIMNPWTIWHRQMSSTDVQRLYWTKGHLSRNRHLEWENVRILKAKTN